MTYVLKPSVEREIDRLFAPKEAEHVRSQLAQQTLPMGQSAPPPRVHIAVLWLSNGDLARFCYELDGASCDWRDTLLAAGLAGDDWKDVLRRKGVTSDGW